MIVRRAAIFLAVFLWSAPGLARGVSAQQQRIDENMDNHSWKLKLNLDYGAAPDRDIVQMVFSFKQTAIYDRVLTDASPDKPTPQTTPVNNATPMESQQEVDFRDDSGKRQKITRFPIVLRRKDDFIAGEYELTVKIPGGGNLGVVRLQLAGENKPVDNRSLNFHADVGAKKKPAVSAKADKPSGAVAAEDQGPDLSDIPSVPGDAKPAAAGEGTTDAAAPPPVEKKGGCQTGPGAPPEATWLAALVALVAARLRRR